VIAEHRNPVSEITLSFSFFFLFLYRFLIWQLCKDNESKLIYGEALLAIASETSRLICVFY
jgi:hypothetical protein